MLLLITVPYFKRHFSTVAYLGFLLLLIKNTRVPGLQNCTHRRLLNKAIHILAHWMLEFCPDQTFLELLVLKLKRMFRLQAAVGSLKSLEPVCCKKQQKKVPGQLLVSGIMGRF